MGLWEWGGGVEMLVGGWRGYCTVDHGSCTEYVLLLFLQVDIFLIFCLWTKNKCWT